MINYTFLISNANFDLNYAVISLPGADSKGGTGSSMELVPVPTHLLISKSRFQLQKILEPHHPYVSRSPLWLSLMLQNRCNISV